MRVEMSIRTDASPRKRGTTVCLHWLAVGFLFASPLGAAEHTSDIEFFEKRVRPVLVQRCYECHSASAKKLKGGLLLDSKEGWRKGGDSGPALVPGEPEKSLLIQAIRWAD